MIDPQDFVYQQIYRGALKAGAIERNARDQAVMGLEDYKKGRFDKAAILIKERIAKAGAEK